MAGWAATEETLSPSQVVSGVVTNTPISREYRVKGNNSIHHVVKISVSAVTVVGSITAKLQTAIGGDWVDTKTVALSGNGQFYIQLLAERTADQQYLPLLNKARIVVSTTNAGDTATIARVDVMEDS